MELVLKIVAEKKVGAGEIVEEAEKPSKLSKNVVEVKQAVGQSDKCWKE